MKKLSNIYKDVLYVSKLTGINKKKLIIIISVVFSQISAFTDIFIILVFAALITGTYEGISQVEPLFNFLSKNLYLLPLIVSARFIFMYYQNSILKNLELNVKRNLQIYFLQEVFDRRNYSVSDAYFYINTLSGHISFFYSNVASFLNSFFQILAFTLYLIISNPSTILTFAGGLIVLYYPISFLLKKARNYMHQNYKFSRKTNQEIQRVVDNLFLIKILKKEQDEVDRFTDTITKTNLSALNNFKVGIVNSFLPSFVTLFVLSIVIGIGTYLSKITLDFIAVTLRLFQSVGNVTSAINKIINSHVHIEKFYQIEKNKGLINKDNFKFKVDENSSNMVVFKDVSFQYLNSDVEIFKNLNLNFKSNTHTIITGPNGSGKSTILGLIAGVFYSSNGVVQTASKKFGYIGAVPLIFDGTLRDNVMYGNQLDIKGAEIEILLKKFKTFKEESNYDLMKNISNKTLSSGQMQKLAFIRALLSDPEVLLLDESTSNLDDYSRNLIFEILEEKKITIINSTHDPEKFRNIHKRYHLDVSEDTRKVLEIN